MKILKLLSAIILSFLPGLFGMFFTPMGNSDAWYNALNKSVMTPDGWVFATAWTLLYFLLGIALFLITDDGKKVKRNSRAFMFFFFHMVLNGLWSALFFGLHRIDMAMGVIVILLTVAFKMYQEFKKLNKYAGYLVLPYIAWLIFATYLNGAILYLN